MSERLTNFCDLPKRRPKTLKDYAKHHQMILKGLHSRRRPWNIKASKRHPKDIEKTPQRNQNSKCKVRAKVIATATPSTQLSNNIASKMTSALRNARSA